MQHHRLSPEERSVKLGDAIEVWQLRGYRLQTRTDTRAHLVKHPSGPLGLVLLLLVVCGAVLLVGQPLAALVAFCVGLVLIFAFQAGRHDKHVNLRTEADGSVFYED